MSRERICAAEALCVIDILRRAIRVLDHDGGFDDDEIARRMLADALDVIQNGYDDIDDSHAGCL